MKLTDLGPVLKTHLQFLHCYFFPGYNDIITSYRVGRSREANRNISSCERKVKVQLPSLKLLGFFFLLRFSPVSHLSLATRWALVLTGMLEMTHAVLVLTVCGTKYKVWTAGNSNFSCINSSAKQH